MKIGLLLPSVLMYERYSREKIFAPKDLFLDLADGLVAQGHDVRVYSASDTKTKALLRAGDDALALSEPPAMKLRYVDEKTKMLLARQGARVEYELALTAQAFGDAQAGKIDIVHSFLEFSAHYFASVTAVPTVYTLHDPVPSEDSLDAWRFRRFPHDQYVAISDNQAQNFAGVVDIAGVVHHGIHADRYQASTTPGEYVLFMGRYMPEKGVEDAIEAGVQTGNRIVIAGAKEYREIAYYQKTIAPLLAHSLVQEVGFLHSSEKTKLMAGAKAILFPIKWEEPFGMVMIEAMACGTPVIAYNRGSVSEIVKDGVTGFVVDPGRGVSGLVEAIKRIGKIDRAACRKHVEEKFSVEQMVKGYERVYEKILSS